MAAERLIVLDIAVLMQSRSPQVFEEMVTLYPGAQKAYDAIKLMPCECCSPMCAQDTFQMLVNQTSHSNKEFAAKFLQEIDEAGPVTYETLREMQHEFFNRTYSWKVEERSESLFQQLFGRPFVRRASPLVAIPPVEPETPTDSLDNDEPEHGGPREE